MTANIKQNHYTKKTKKEHVHGPDCDHEKTQPNVNDEPKVGRNDPCACGSLKKFKKCCGK